VIKSSRRRRRGNRQSRYYIFDRQAACRCNTAAGSRLQLQLLFGVRRRRGHSGRRSPGTFRSAPAGHTARGLQNRRSPTQIKG